MPIYNDYGAGAIGSAVQGLLQGLQAGEETKMRKEEFSENKRFREMELNARMKADDESRARQKALDEYTRQKDADERRQKEFQLGAELRTKGFQVPSVEEGQSLYDVSPSQLKYDPEYLALKRKTESAASDPYGMKDLAAQKARDEAEKRNATKEFDVLPKEKQLTIESLAKSASTREQIQFDIQTSLDQLKDPNISDDEKIKIAQESIKTLNSLQGSDAVGAEEVKRLASALEFKIIPRLGEPGNLFGRDMELFTKQVENNLNRLRKNSELSAKKINELYGRKGIMPLMRDEGEMAPNQGAAQGADIKVIGGVTYKKVPGGWAEVPKSAGR